MAKFFQALEPVHAEFLAAQSIFFVASAAAGARINLSPKGLDTLRVLGPNAVAYLDLTGSGAETAAHLKADGRLTLMACAFAGPPLILRLYGRGETVPRAAPRFAELAPAFGERAVDPAARAIIHLAVELVQTSCGFAVPRMRLEGKRPVLDDWAAKQGPEKLAAYRAKKNAKSLDGLPTGLLPAAE